MQGDEPALTLVVPTLCGAHRLPGLLAALANQQGAPPWEVVVVLDGVADDTPRLLAGWSARLPLRVLTLPESRGVAAALNAGLAAARGPVVVRCDDDLAPPPHFLRRIAEHHRDPDRRVGVIAPTRDVFADTPYARAYGSPASDRIVAAAVAAPPEQRWVYWAACNSARRADVEPVGGFDESLAYREDSDLGRRLWRSGVELIVDPDLEVAHTRPAADAATRLGRAFLSGAAVAPGTSPAETGRRHDGHRPLERAWWLAQHLVAANLRSQSSAVRAGAVLDRALPVLPAGLGGRLVALGVEGAGIAGRRSGRAEWDKRGEADKERTADPVPRAGARPDDPPLDQATVSVVIPHHGRPEPTLALVGGLDADPTVTEILVVDDASPTPLSEHHLPSRTTVLRRDVNGGFGAAVNTGAARATGRLLLILNSDLEVPAGFVTDLRVAAAPHLPAVVSPRVVSADGAEAHTARRFPRIRHQVAEWLSPLARFHHRRWYQRLVGYDLAVARDGGRTDWVVGAALLLRRADFEAVEGFDERYFMNCEEIDLQRRLHAAGLGSVALAAPTVVHRSGGSTPSDRHRAWLVESRLRYADATGSRRPLQAALLAATTINLGVNLGRRLAGRDVAPWRTARREAALVLGRGSMDPREPGTGGGRR